MTPLACTIQLSCYRLIAPVSVQRTTSRRINEERLLPPVVWHAVRNEGRGDSAKDYT